MHNVSNCPPVWATEVQERLLLPREKSISFALAHALEMAKEGSRRRFYPDSCLSKLVRWAW